MRVSPLPLAGEVGARSATGEAGGWKCDVVGGAIRIWSPWMAEMPGMQEQFSAAFGTFSRPRGKEKKLPRFYVGH